MICENVLEDLYYGNIQPSAKCFDTHSQYAKLIKIISDNEEKLTSFLSEPSTAQEQRLLAQLINAQNEVLAFSEISRFIEGFQLGARFMLDTFILPRESVVRDII